MEALLKSRVNKDYMKALKEKNSLKKNLFSVIKGEIQRVEKNQKLENLSDEEVLKIITKTYKSLKEMESLGNESSKEESLLLESYLPKLLSEEEVREIIKGLIYVDESINIGKIMSHFSNFSADKKSVSSIAREELTKI